MRPYLPFLGDLLEAREHIGPGDRDLVHAKKPGVVGDVPELGAEIADLDALERTVVLVAYLHDERVHAELPPLHDQLRIHQCVGRDLPEGARPPLCRGQGRRVHDKRVRRGIVSCLLLKGGECSKRKGIQESTKKTKAEEINEKR